MVERLACHLPAVDLAERFNVDMTMPRWPARYNIRPGEAVPAIIQDRNRRLGRMHWGWPQAAHHRIATRKEDLVGPLADSLNHRRCVVLATAWYVWAPGTCGTRGPWAVRPHGCNPIAIAALWQADKRQQDGVDAAASLITVPACEELWPLGQRMPAVLSIDQLADWLAPTTAARRLRGMLESQRFIDLRAYEVGLGLMSERDDAAMLEPIGQD